MSGSTMGFGRKEIIENDLTADEAFERKGSKHVQAEATSREMSD